MSEDKEVQLERFRFTELFSVEFYVEAENYQKAKDMYGKMFDKNIQLGYDTWKNVSDKDITGGKFYVRTKNNGKESILIEELWGDMEEEE